MAKNLVSVIRQVIDAYMESFETAMPGIIDKVNDDGTVDVIPSIRNCLTNMQIQNGGGALEALPEIPVLFPGTATALVKFELKKGDTVLLVASSRDLSAWAGEGWDKAPFNPLTFDGNDLNDLMALPVRRQEHGAEPKTTIEIAADGSVTVKASGEVTIGASEVTVDASKSVFKGSLSVEGDLEAGGNIEATGDVSAMAKVKPVSLASHVHTSAAPGSPTSPPV